MSHPPAPDTTTTGSAPTRLCLGGEDLDWLGGPALLTAIDLRVSVTYHRQPAGRSLTISAEGAMTTQVTVCRDTWHTPTTSDLELIRLCWQHATDPPTGGWISIQSGAPPNAGLASSATACVAALRALRPPDPAEPVTGEDLIQTAYHVEHDLAGRPVGPMDFVPAVLGGTTLVATEAEAISGITPLPLPPEARFLVIDTRTPRDTGAVIAWKRARLADGEHGIRIYADRMQDLVDEQARILRQGGSLEDLGDTLNQAQALLTQDMKASTPLIDTCVDRLRASGALGVKLTGTGLGGCLFALTTATADTDRLAQSVSDLPVSARLVTLGRID